MYAAHTVADGTLHGAKVYWADETAASALACSSQYQVCSGENCTPLTAGDDLRILAANVWSSQEQRDLFSWFYHHVGFYTIGGPALNLGPGCLRARDGLSRGLQNPLPDNQWQLEVQHWFAVALTNLQSSTIYSVIGPKDENILRWMNTNMTQSEQERCNDQVSL